MQLESFGDNLRIVIVGSSGGIGSALLEQLANNKQISQIYALSRRPTSHASNKITSLSFDFTDENSLEATTKILTAGEPLDIILVSTGLLQGDGISPEKNLRALSRTGFAKSFEINATGPALTAKHFIPLLRRDRKAVFAALSARVGSISDNRLGGWYAYRASKAALNMTLKTLAIEIARRFKNQIIVGLHPGTVDTPLSKPFQSNVPDEKLFTADKAAEHLLNVIDGLTPKDSGYLFDWAGDQIEF